MVSNTFIPFIFYELFGTSLTRFVPADIETQIIRFLCTDLGWVRASRVNPQAVKRRVEDLLTSRSISSSLQPNWLARAIQCIDLTTLAGMMAFSYLIFNWSVLLDWVASR